MATTTFGQLQEMWQRNPADCYKVAKAYLDLIADKSRASHADRQRMAYEIAGLLATNFGQSLDDKDPYRQVFELAGQLELPVAQRWPGSSWRKMRRLIAGLGCDGQPL